MYLSVNKRKCVKTPAEEYDTEPKSAPVPVLLVIDRLIHRIPKSAEWGEMASKVAPPALIVFEQDKTTNGVLISKRRLERRHQGPSLR